ncbi:MAG: PAS domain S-box protein [Candidatus Omnitrophica bacterium]|nr:PAS domain S-box protein [Candidatus Omnitrophota bacterium]
MKKIKDWKIRNKLLATFGVIFTLAAILCAHSVASLVLIQRHSRDLEKNGFSRLIIVTQLKELVCAVSSLFEQRILMREPDSVLVKDIEKKASRLRTLIVEFKEIIKDSDKELLSLKKEHNVTEQILLRSMNRLEESFDNFYAKGIQALKAYADNDDLRLKSILAEFHLYAEKLNREFGEFEEENISILLISLARIDTIGRQSKFVQLLLVFLVLIIGTVVSIFLIQGITVALKQLVEGTLKIAQGDLDFQMQVETQDEFSQLSESFNEMTQNLKKLTVSHEYVDNIIKSISDVLFVLDKYGRIKKVNHAAYDILGYYEEDLLNKYVGTIFSEDEVIEEEIINKIEDPAMLISKDFDVLKVNDAFLAMHGFKKENVIGIKCYKITHGLEEICNISSGHACPLQKEAAVKNSTLIEVHRHLNEEGEPVMVDVIAAPVYGADGEVIYYLHIARETKGKVLAEDIEAVEALVEKLKIYRGLLERKHVYRNPIVENLLKEGALKGMEVNCKAKDDRIIPFMLSGSAIKNSKGELDGIVCIGRDISEHKLFLKREHELDKILTVSQIEANRIRSLDEANKQWNDTFNSINDLIFIADNNYNIIKANKAFLDFSGQHEQDIMTKKCFEVFYPDNNSLEHCPLKKKEGIDKKSVTYETKHVYSGVPYLLTVSPIFSEQGQCLGVVHVAKNIEERKKIEIAQQLSQLGRMVAEMAHELNNPLQVILSNSQLALMQGIENENIRKKMELILNQTEFSRDIIARLLKFSKPKMSAFKATNLNSIVKAIVSILEHQYFLRSVYIVTDFSILPDVFVDEKAIQEMIMSLCQNAFEAIPQKGIIEIKTSFIDKFAKLDIIDSGCGIAPENIDKIFEPFFTTKEKGTGLGLAICQSIVNENKGVIKISSVLGKGTTVTVLLPMSKAEKIGNG